MKAFLVGFPFSNMFLMHYSLQRVVVCFTNLLQVMGKDEKALKRFNKILVIYTKTFDMRSLHNC